MALFVTALYHYPIKSAGAIALSEAEITPRGIEHDRRWMVVDSEGRFLTQRSHPRLARVAVFVRLDGLRMETEGEAPCSVSTISTDAPRQVVVWDDVVEAVDAGDAPADWLSRVLGAPCRLMYMPDSSRRRVDPAYGAPGDVVSFADGYPVLLTTEASLTELNTRLHQPVPMARFRPNVVLNGILPYEDDAWRLLEIGEVRFRLVKSCARCVITTLDPEAGVFQKEPLRTLATYRRRNGKVFFGQNLIPDGVGRIRVGDPVRVLA